MKTRIVRPLVALASAVLILFGAASAEAQGTTPRRRGRAPRCPPGSSWMDAARACVGTATCPQGFHLVGTGSCEPDELRCPEGSTLEAGSCIRPATCPEGTTAEGDRCLRPATCAAGTRLIEGRCVGQTVSCPTGSRADASGRCTGSVACPTDFHYEQGTGCVLDTPRTAPAPVTTCARTRSEGRVGHDVAHFELRAGMGYAGYDLIERGVNAPTSVPEDYFGGLLFRTAIGFNYEPFVFSVNYQHLFADTDLGHSFNQLTGEFLARCACWSSFYEWRLGLELGYDFSAEAIVANAVHVSQFDLKKGVFLSLEARAGALLGELTDGLTAVGASAGFFVGYQR